MAGFLIGRERGTYLQSDRRSTERETPNLRSARRCAEG
jgi:hypothetical protein